LFGCAELTLLLYPFKLKSQNDVGQGGIGDNSIEEKSAGEEKTERKRTGKGLTGYIQRKKQKNTRDQSRK
jgi:hypothetical protein